MEETRKGKESPRIELPAPPVPSGDIADEQHLRRFLEAVGVASLALRMDCLEREYQQALQSRNEDLSPWQDRLRSYLADGRIARVVSDWGPRVTDPQVRRELLVLERRGLAARVGTRETVELQDRLRRRLSMFRPEIDGVEVPLSIRTRSLRGDRNREDREEAHASIGPLQEACAEDLRHLMVLRNRHAQALGYPDAPSLLLSLMDIPADACVALVEAVEERTRDPYRASLARVQEAAGVPELRPWDIPFGLERIEEAPGARFPKREAAQMLDRTFSDLGFDTEEMPIRIRDAEIPYGGLCYAFLKPRESRILVSPTDGALFLRVLFHEFGHGVHNVLEQETSPILMHSWDGAWNEGIAEVFAGILLFPSWHVRYAERTAAQAEEVTQAFLVDRLHRLRSRAMQFSFEVRAYAALATNPEADLQALANETERRFLLVDPHPGSYWASWAPMTTHPAYWQNYVVAACIADGIWEALRQRAGGDPVGNPSTGKLLTETLLTPLPREGWPARLEGLLGQPLAASFLRVPRG